VRILVNLIGAVGAALFFRASVQFYLHTHRLIGGLFVIEQAWFVVAFLVRRPQRAVSRRIGSWLLAFGGTYGGVLFRPDGAHQPWAVDTGFGLQLAGLVICIISLLALGRSFGFVAADRGLKTRGPYAVVRHPVYASTSFTAGARPNRVSNPLYLNYLCRLALPVLKVHWQSGLVRDSLGRWSSNRSKSPIKKAAESAVNKSSGAIAGRVCVLRERNFRRFFVGYATSLLGTSMSSVAVAFAVLDSGGSASDLGYVFAAGIVPQVLFMLGGGVIADRLGRRPVMLAADAARACSQGALAAAVLLGRPQTWVFAALAAIVGTGDAFFGPSLSALTVQIAPRDELGNANALLGLGQSAARVAGPALAGILVAVTGPGVVIAVDAGTYAVSVLALSMLRLPGFLRVPSRPLLRELGEGWSEFRSRTWLWVGTVQFALFNLIVWGPYLLLGPVLSRQYLGGARAWGTIMAAYGAGAIAGGLLALGRKPRHPLVVATAATFGYPAPCLLFALHAPVLAVAAGSLVAGAGSAIGLTFESTAQQQQVPAAALARVSAFGTVGAFGFGPLAFAAAGPAAAVVGARTVLAFGAAWGILSSAVVLAVPAVRAVTWASAAPDE
jgi:MFS family permease/protein-S-isoprenylcysteine O-methyltransferase Ste14